MLSRFLRVFNLVKDTHQNYLTLEISWITTAIAGTDPEINQGGDWLISYNLVLSYYVHSIMSIIITTEFKVEVDRVLVSA